MNEKRQERCWVLTDGRAGNENQCLGLAAALGIDPVVKRIRLRFPWKQLSPYLKCGLSNAFSDLGDSVVPPWPDLLIATGRASVPASLYIHRKSREEGGTGTFTVQIQNPVIDVSHFDLVVAPRHDGLEGLNVMAPRGSMHRVTPELVRREAEKFASLAAGLSTPRIAVLIGGSNAVYKLTPKEMTAIVGRLVDVAKATGGSLMVTTSPRTGADNLAVLKEGLKAVPSYIWDGRGDNPYFGMLGLADAVLVTCDSVNMVSEACATGKPVYVIELAGGSDKFRRFHQSMQEGGFTRPFAGKIEKWKRPPFDEVQDAAARIKSMMGARCVGKP